MAEQTEAVRLQAAKESLEQSAADFVLAMAEHVHGPNPLPSQIAEITRTVVANTRLGRYL